MNDYFRRKHPPGQGIYLNMVFGINQGRPGQRGKTIERQIGEARVSRHLLISRQFYLFFTFHRFTRKRPFLFLLHPIEVLHFLDSQDDGAAQTKFRKNKNCLNTFKLSQIIKKTQPSLLPTSKTTSLKILFPTYQTLNYWFCLYTYVCNTVTLSSSCEVWLV